MKPAALVFVFLLIPALCRAEPVRLDAGRTTRVAVSGATAAFSLDSTCAEASAEDGLVTITGRGPGSTTIVVVTSVGTATLEVVVLEAPATYPPGFRAPGALGPQGQNASYEFRFSSASAQQQNAFDAAEQQDGRTFRLHVVNANLFGERPTSASPVVFPAVTYEMKSSRRDVTLLDQYVMSSPLTVANTLVRGLHVREGRWTFHGGFSSMSAFQNLFLPSDRESVVGASYAYPLTGRSHVAGNVYVFPSRPSSGQGVASGVVGSVLYEYKPGRDTSLLAEAGISHGGGFALRAEKDDKASQFRASVRYQSPQFAGLSVDSTRGLLSDGTWTRVLSPRVSLHSSFYANHYTLPQFRQTNLGVTSLVKYDLNPHIALTGGGIFGQLSPEVPPGFHIKSVSIPAGIDLNWKRFSVGYQHTFTHNSGQDRGQEDRLNVGTGWQGWHLNGFMDRQTQAPTAEFIVSQTPGLREVIDRLGLAATSAEQIAQLVRQESVLVQLGYVSGIYLNIAPVRTQAGLNLLWAGEGRLAPQITGSVFYNDNQFLTGEARTAIATVSFMSRISSSLDLLASSSLFNTLAPRGTTPERQWFLDFSLRHRFGRAPGWVFPNLRGTISGRVFEDDEQSGRWQPRAKGLDNVMVVLDRSRRIRTGHDGRFVFADVTSGEHEIEVLFDSTRPFYFTTASHRAVSVNSQTDFGIAFAASMMVGHVVNDAGSGIPGVQLTISGEGRSWETATDGEGKFTVPGLIPGDYLVTPNVDSFPPGYVLTDVATVRARVPARAPGRAEFTVRAARALAGIVTVYDRMLARQVPVEGITVGLRELNLETTTGKDGAYVFRDLPAGQYTIVVIYEGRELIRSERLGAEPVFIRNADINLGAR